MRKKKKDPSKIRKSFFQLQNIQHFLLPILKSAKALHLIPLPVRWQESYWICQHQEMKCSNSLETINSPIFLETPKYSLTFPSLVSGNNSILSMNLCKWAKVIEKLSKGQTVNARSGASGLIWSRGFQCRSC